MSKTPSIYAFGESGDNSTDTICVKPYGSERPLRITLVILGVLLWFVIIASIVGAAYAIFLGVFFFIAHMSLIAYLRGSAVKLGPQQIPELHNRIVTIAKRLGFKKMPDAYLMQSGGALNAFATRFMGTNFVVLYADIVDACGDNGDALDFIIAHELGHLHRGHLKWRWLIIPAYFIPFLGSAYSRACEFTCDRYGYLATSNHEKSLQGLCILAAGPKHAALLNRKEFAAQSRDLDTVFMRLGEWLASHPALALRLAALHPELKPEKKGSTAFVTAIAFLLGLGLVTVPVVGVAFIAKAAIHDVQNKMKQQPAYRTQ